jgi:hypothetical protein
MEIDFENGRLSRVLIGPSLGRTFAVLAVALLTTLVTILGTLPVDLSTIMRALLSTVAW